jgi:hypothetical protein
MLGGAKKSIFIHIIKNDEAITVERSLITLEDFHIIHAKVVCQLALVENLLKVVIRLRNQSFTIGLLRDYEDFVCEMNDIKHVQVQSEMSLQGVNLGLRPSIFECLQRISLGLGCRISESEFKDFETRKECVLNTKRYQMSNSGSQTQICVHQKAKVDACILEFEKKKIRVS